MPAWSPLLLLTCLASLCAAQNGPQVFLQGRFSPGAAQVDAASLPQTFSWAASSVYASFEEATSVKISITALPANNVTSAITWFRFFVDNVSLADGFTSYKQLELDVTLNVTTAPHTLRIAKMSDSAKGEATLNSISINTGSFTKVKNVPSLDSGRRILYLGDSYGVGYGNAGAGLPNTCLPDVTQLQKDWLAVCTAEKIPLDDECANFVQAMNGNALAAPAALTARAFNADFQLLASAGVGLVGYSNAVLLQPKFDAFQLQQTLPSNALMFNQTLFTGGGLPNYSGWVPQIVIVGSGTNDWHTVPPIYSLQSWIADALAFLTQVSSVYNQPKIIIQAWPAAQQLANAPEEDFASDITVQYQQAMPSLFSAAVKRGIPNVYYLQLTTQNYDDTDAWCDKHPSAVADKAVADQLVSFIDSVFPDWSTSIPVNLTVDQQYIRPNLSFYTDSYPSVPTSG